MKKILVIITLFFLFSNTSFANEEILIKNNNIQSRIDNIGTKILNSNKLDKRVIFAYDENGKSSLIKADKAL